MAISAADVKNLREKTGAGMMDCKKALTETNGDREAAVDFLRAKGLSQAAKKASRVAAEGMVGVLTKGSSAVLVEVNCETDFVAKGEDFRSFVTQVAEQALEQSPPTLEALQELANPSATELTLKCGEKVEVRRYQRMDMEGPGLIGHYSHGGKIGVLIQIAIESDVASHPEAQELAKSLAMHVAATDPKFISGDDIDEAFKKREADIYAAQLKEQGKPEQMIDKIVIGKLNKLAREVCLLEQKFVKDPDISVRKYVEQKAKSMGTDVRVVGMMKLNLGEGVEKRQDNLAEEVAKMTGGKG